MDSKLRIIIDFIQGCENLSYHPIKKKYIVLSDFIKDGKVIKRGSVIMHKVNNERNLKLHDDQSNYEENLFYLKEYVLFRASMGEKRFDYKEITFNNSFDNIRIGNYER